MNAAETFRDALEALLSDNGGPLPCWDRSNGNPWAGDTDTEGREYATHQCRTCPLVSQCYAMAVQLHATCGVCGGVTFPRGNHRARP